MKSSGDEVKAFFTENRKKILIITKPDSPSRSRLLALDLVFDALGKPPSTVATFFIRHCFATILSIGKKKVSIFVPPQAFHFLSSSLDLNLNLELDERSLFSIALRKTEAKEIDLI